MTDVRAEVLEALRTYAKAYRASELSLARAMDLPATDGVALGELMWAERAGTPLSPVALSRRVGLTSGATNALVNRLEAHGLVRRSREHDDRRVVTLRPTPLAHERARPHVGAGTGALDDALASYDDAELAQVRDFLLRFAEILPRD